MIRYFLLSRYEIIRAGLAAAGVNIPPFDDITPGMVARAAVAAAGGAVAAFAFCKLLPALLWLCYYAGLPM